MDAHSESTSRRRQRRDWRVWVFAGVLLATIAALAWFRYSLSRRVQGRLAAITQAGYPDTTQKLEKWLGWVPAKENAALRFMEASSSLLPPESVSTNLNNLIGSSSPHNQPPLAAGLLQPLGQLITNNFSALQSIHEGASLTNSRYVVNWSNGYQTLLPHLNKIKGLAQLVRLEIILHSEERKPDLAVQSLQDLLGLAHSLVSEPLILSQMVRSACLAIGCSALEWLLTQNTLSENQLNILMDGLSQAEAETSMTRALAGERCIGIDLFELSSRGLIQFFQSSASPVQSNLFGFVSGLRNLSGLRDRDFLLYLEIMDQSLNTSKTHFPQRLDEAKRLGQRINKELRDHKFLLLSRMLVTASGEVLIKEAEMIARLRLAQTALAIEQHRLQHNGQLPEGLDELSNPDGASARADPFDGKPLRYKKLANGYMVYSIGKNARDEGGQEKRQVTRAGTRKANQSDDVAFRVERY